MADFQNGLTSPIFGCFLQRFFAQNNSNVPVESFFARFWPFEFFTQTDHFAKCIAFARWPIFKMVSLLQYLVFFAQKNSNVLVESFFKLFWPFEVLTQTDHFAKSIAFARWPIFKIVSFRQYLVFFLHRFFPQNNSNVLVDRFSHVFGHLNFWPKLTILQSAFARWPLPLQDGRFLKWSHFSNIWCFFQRFFAQNNSNLLVESFLVPFWPFEFLSQADHFAKSIAFARWPIFKMVSFLEYLVFFPAVFCTEQL